jgi:hypothetical protein
MSLGYHACIASRRVPFRPPNDAEVAWSPAERPRPRGAFFGRLVAPAPPPHAKMRAHQGDNDHRADCF